MPIIHGPMAQGYYLFGCTVSFQCPICGRASSEKIVWEATRYDPDAVALSLSRQPFDCQQCGAAGEGRKRLTIQVLPAGQAQLRRLGFALPRAA